jgi:flagellar hook-length control protein FliK
MSRTMLSGRRLWVIALLAVFCAFLLPSWSHADQGELDNVQKAIKEKKAKWVAGTTSVSDLSLEAKKKRVGALKPVLTEEDEKAAKEEQEALAVLTAPSLRVTPAP